ncbi:MAG: hypothetical protein ACI80I_000296, partial [Akkermansiaceae bacterium]
MKHLNACLGHLALICATLLALTSSATAFDAPTRIDRSLSLNSLCELNAFVRNLNGGLASVRVSPLSSGSAQPQGARGVGFVNGGLTTALSAVTTANLQAHCSLADVTNLVQQGAAGGYSGHGLIQLSFQATQTPGGDAIDGNRYDYLAEIRGGATATTVTVDRTLVNEAPTVTLGSPSGPDGSGKYTVIATLSENSTDFTVGDLTLTNATATLSGSGSSYTIVLTQTAVGSVKLSVPKGAFTDSAGLGNWVPSSEVEFDGDTTAPTVSIAAFTGAVNSNKTAVITLSEASSDFAVGDLTLTNATATLTGSGTSYTAVLTPSSDGEVKLSVGAGTFTDAVGNGNTVSNEVTTTYDTTAPTVSIGAFTGAANGNKTAVITLSEVSNNFAVGDLTLTNAAATLSGSGTSYTAVLTPSSDGEVKLSVAANTFTDAAGYDNSASNEVSSTYDSTAPTVSIAAFTGAANGNQTAVITLSEASTDFAVGDLTLTNATATLSGSGTSYTAVLTPSSDGEVKLSVAAGTFTDGAGNANAVSNEVTVGYDSTAPTVSIAAFTGAANGTKTAVITLSEASSDFAVGDLTLTNAAATLSGSGTSYTALLTPSSDGEVKLSVAAGTFTDGAGNANAASNEVTTTYDASAPSVSVSTSATSVSGAETINVVVTFSEAVTGFDASDIAVTNGSVSTVSGSGAAYVAQIMATGSGNTAVSVPAAAAIDSAGNSSTASNTVTIQNATV